MSLLRSRNIPEIKPSPKMELLLCCAHTQIDDETTARIRENGEGTPYVVQHPMSPISEAFRTLRSNIEFSSVDRPIRTLLITSPGAEEGKSTVVVNLAAVIAQGGRKVIVLDSDLRRPCIHRLLGVTNRIGLSDLFVRSGQDLNGVMRQWRMENLSFITSGDLPPNPAELLGSERMGQIMGLVSSLADIVIMDSSPADVVTDAAVLAAQVDAVLIVMEPNRTVMGAAVRAVEQLQRAGANVIGLVFNNFSPKRYAYYKYHYSYSYSDNGKENTGRGLWRGRAKRTKVRRQPRWVQTSLERQGKPDKD